MAVAVLAWIVEYGGNLGGRSEALGTCAPQMALIKLHTKAHGSSRGHVGMVSSLLAQGMFLSLYVPDGLLTPGTGVASALPQWFAHSWHRGPFLPSSVAPPLRVVGSVGYVVTPRGLGPIISVCARHLRAE